MRQVYWTTVLLQTCLLAVAKDFPVYAALGDSYAAGAGPCGGFDSAYPVLIANDTRLEFMEFLNLACGGASTASVEKTQVPHIGDADVVTITVGGNEGKFPSRTVSVQPDRGRFFLRTMVGFDRRLSLPI